MGAFRFFYFFVARHWWLYPTGVHTKWLKQRAFTQGSAYVHVELRKDERNGDQSSRQAWKVSQPACSMP